MITHRILSLIISILSLQSFASIKVIYGEDNRKDVYQTSNPLYLQLSNGTAAMVSKNQISKMQNHFALTFSYTLQSEMNICPTERFSEQPIGATCSGFLINEDTLVTAGHCFQMRSEEFPTPESVCQGFDWVFDYSVTQSGQNPLDNLTNDDVYHCKTVVTAQLNALQDFAVIKLDRKVVGHKPLKIRTTGITNSNTELVVIGHPSGLPTKISDGGQILDNSNPRRFVTNLDTFQGNSGSAVFDGKSGLLEGILVQGKTDYRPSQPGNPSSCFVVNRCTSDGKKCEYGNSASLTGEVVTRITEILPYLIVPLNK
jgi:V8-like Glu-specific endopeptidase